MSVELSLEASVGAGVRVEGVAVARPLQAVHSLLPPPAVQGAAQVVQGRVQSDAKLGIDIIYYII